MALAAMTRRMTIFLAVLVMIASTTVSAQSGLGGEKAAYDTQMFDESVRHRSNVCDRHRAMENGTVDLKDALEGMQLQVLAAAYDGAYFEYTPEGGISTEYSGLAAILMDELARRGKFTWRDTFGLSYAPDGNRTWNDLLVWGTDTYDVFLEWWAPNLDRMNLGVAFVKEWYDSSIILLKLEEEEIISDDINFWNWLRPYDYQVWLVTLTTIFLSGLVYQWLEYLQEERGDRDMWEWWCENWYLSAINFTQAYEYQPKSLASRLFGISMAVWALVMTATYTANLASLLVDREPPALAIESIEEVAYWKHTVCTWEGVYSDAFIEETYQSVVRVPKKTILEQYEALRAGDCDFVAEAVASWKQNRGYQLYNPMCDIEWVGGERIVKSYFGGFATRADSGTLCTGLVRDVLNWHMENMIKDGFLEAAWNREYSRKQDMNCATFRPDLLDSSYTEAATNNTNATDDDGRRRRRLVRTRDSYERQQLQQQPRHRQRRQLKAGGKGAAAGAVAAQQEADPEAAAQRLTLNQMIGTFAFHWVMMFVAVSIANITILYEKYHRQSANKNSEDTKEANPLNSQPSKQTEYTKEISVDDISSSPYECSRDQVSTYYGEKVNEDAAQDLSPELAFLRQSQSQMQEFQTKLMQEQHAMRKQMLEEQRQFQTQMRTMLAAKGTSGVVHDC